MHVRAGCIMATLEEEKKGKRKREGERGRQRWREEKGDSIEIFLPGQMGFFGKSGRTRGRQLVGDATNHTCWTAYTLHRRRLRSGEHSYATRRWAYVKRYLLCREREREQVTVRWKQISRGFPTTRRDVLTIRSDWKIIGSWNRYQ